MIIDKNTYELNKTARKFHPCINPQCANFTEIENSYNICMRCFDMLVDYLGSEHLVFDYGTKPALRCMTIKQMKSMLRRAEARYSNFTSKKRGNSNSQRRWICENEVTESRKFISSNRQK